MSSATPALVSASVKEASEDNSVTFVKLATMASLTARLVSVTLMEVNPSKGGLWETARIPIQYVQLFSFSASGFLVIEGKSYAVEQIVKSHC